VPSLGSCDVTDEPDVPGRVEPPYSSDEATMLHGFLDYHRATLKWKVSGLDAEALNRTLAPSTMTLGGLLKHLALVEDHWFSVMLHGNEQAKYWREVEWEADWDYDWHSAEADTPEELGELFDASVARSREITAGVDLDTESAARSRRTDEPFTLRWILLHMIEEYARHNGHADLVRESIDGQTGE
jgi:uncharacterized damage-inducible protein DinB